ncbi:hypothetical protein HSR121_1972 [Halapricum desulfuricans]|uniref:Uncharacterized protein n=1 Tax=Halapricum desulfuricans TaxID=2841257 RepID=A0A897N7E5_9EURY|nr:hypothetical protein HSR121_1972 [Halapricum desulfuricans]
MLLGPNVDGSTTVVAGVAPLFRPRSRRRRRDPGEQSGISVADRETGSSFPGEIYGFLR